MGALAERALQEYRKGRDEGFKLTPLLEKQAIEAQVKQIVLAAYELDNYGDLGDAVKINSAYEKFTKAVSALTALVAPRRQRRAALPALLGNAQPGGPTAARTGCQLNRAAGFSVAQA